jgi:uracil-DNA glycosylase family 4
MKVAGEGPESPRLMVVGEAPGKVEDACGRPFVGPSGTLFRKALEEAGWDIDKEVYFTNLVRCMPKLKNGDFRKPTEDEINECSSYLLQLVIEKKPLDILVVGRIPYVTMGSVYHLVPTLWYAPNPTAILRADCKPTESSQYKEIVRVCQNIRGVSKCGKVE